MKSVVWPWKETAHRGYACGTYSWGDKAVGVEDRVIRTPTAGAVRVLLEAVIQKLMSRYGSPTVDSYTQTQSKDSACVSTTLAVKSVPTKEKTEEKRRKETSPLSARRAVVVKSL